MNCLLTMLSQRVILWASCLAVVLVTSATSLAPPRVDDAMVERSVSGAEWLVKQALNDPKGLEDASRETELVDWLLVASGAFDSEYDAFAEHLFKSGYQDPLFAVSEWLEEISRVLLAAKASERASDIRPVSVIQDDIDELPAVPKDNAEQEARERLLEEWVLSTVPQEARQAASAAQIRIDALHEIFQRETNK